MAAQEQFLLNTHFIMSIMGSFNNFLHRKLFVFASSFWVSVYALFDSIAKAIFRVKGNRFSQIKSCLRIGSNWKGKEDDEAKEPEIEVNQSKNTQEDDDDYEEPKFVFKFEYQTSQENYKPIVSDFLSSKTTNLYKFLNENDGDFHLKKPQVLGHKVKELCSDSVANEGTFCGEKAQEEDEIAMDIVVFRDSDSASDTSCPEVFVGSTSDGNIYLGEAVDEDFQAENFVAFQDSNSDCDCVSSSAEASVGLTRDGILSKKDFEKANLEQLSEEIDEDFQAKNIVTFQDSDSDSDPITSSAEAFVGTTGDGFLSNKDLQKAKIEQQSEETDEDWQAEKNSGQEESCSDKETSATSQDSSAMETDDPNELESLRKYQELIEQLKMRIKGVRASGLPTILEEDESPEIVEELKPWKINVKLQSGDRIGDIHKLYKSYRERMRKLDVLNFQKMFAMRFLQSKVPHKSISSKRSSSLAHKFLRRKSTYDQTTSFIKDHHCDLEMVYVGQMCLSWEILHWQYEKALDIWDSDTNRIRRYSDVSGELQRFQVLLQRFMENEGFEGPRVECFAKNRCVLRHLLQVPFIREDDVKDKGVRRRAAKDDDDDDDDAITSDRLVEILEECIRLFWRFLRADKDAHNVIQRSRKQAQTEPSQLELLTQVRTSLQKKGKRLKDAIRGGNCVLRKFQKIEEEEEEQEQEVYFFSEVDMMLVTRVLNMSKITADQLIWCNNKLNQINVFGPKIIVEPTFLLFPS